MKISSFTYILGLLVMGSLGLTFIRSEQTRSSNSDKTGQQEKKDRFPTADYNGASLADPGKEQLRKDKQKRHNNFKIVAREPPDWQTERVFVGEGALSFPSLPVAESNYVVLGRVTRAEAHLSENKKNVYSEFTVVVEKVFKTARGSIIEGSEITVDRIGGYVKYPNGRTLLYRVAATNMPAVEERYLFFLTSKNNEDLVILTAYAMTVDGVVPLDQSEQFEEFRGLKEDVFLQKLRDLLARSSPY